MAKNMTFWKARIEKDLTQWECAVAAGCPQSKISCIELGMVRPTWNQASALSKLLDVPVEELFPYGTGRSDDAKTI
jgi:DNA-binding XRE family transcriptional regulator